MDPKVEPMETVDETKIEPNPSLVESLETGDIILFSRPNSCFKNPFSFCISCCTFSKYSHVGMVLKDPMFVKEGMHGYYILDSTAWETTKDVETDQIDFGVQVRDLPQVIKEYGGKVYIRKLNVERDARFYAQLAKLYGQTMHTDYCLDVDDYFRAWLGEDIGNTQETDSLYCSAYIAYLLAQLKVLPKKTPWMLVRPKEFGDEKKRRHFIDAYVKLGDLQRIRFKDFP